MIKEDEKELLEDIVSFETGINLKNLIYLKKNIPKEYHKFLNLEEISNFKIRLKSNKATINMEDEEKKIKVGNKWYNWEEFFNVFCISTRRKK